MIKFLYGKEPITFAAFILAEVSGILSKKYFDLDKNANESKIEPNPLLSDLLMPA